MISSCNRFSAVRLGLVLWIVLASLGCATKAARVERIQHRHWPDCLRLSNGTVELVVVPAAGGRIMRYGYIGGANAIWENESGEKTAGWVNYGGDKVWIWPQDQWAPVFGRAWPPPETMDQASYTAEVLSDSTIRLTSPRFGRNGLQIVRDIRLSPSGTGVDFEMRLVSPSDEPSEGSSLWTVTQIPTAHTLRTNLGPTARSAPRWKFVTGSGDVAVGTDGWSTITMPKRSNAKVILDANAVIAQRGDVRFEQQYCDPAESGSDSAVERCQIYSNPPLPEGTPPGPYQELEFTSPRQPVTRSHPARMHIRWTLTKTSAATPAIAKPRNSTPSSAEATR